MTLQEYLEQQRSRLALIEKWQAETRDSVEFYAKQEEQAKRVDLVEQARRCKEQMERMVLVWEEVKESIRSHIREIEALPPDVEVFG